MPGLTVLAGSARGRKLKLPHFSLGVRPMLARIKKSLFDILKNRITGSRFLDLFAGTGCVGIEAISRSAKEAVFVEAESGCVKVIKENLKMLGFESLARVHQSDVIDYLSRSGYAADIIFMGPPYKDKNGMLYLSMPVVEKIDGGEILAEDGLLIVQHHKKEPVGDCGRLAVFREEKYGDTILAFFRK